MLFCLLMGGWVGLSVEMRSMVVRSFKNRAKKPPKKFSIFAKRGKKADLVPPPFYNTVQQIFAKSNLSLARFLPFCVAMIE